MGSRLGRVAIAVLTGAGWSAPAARAFGAGEAPVTPLGEPASQERPRGLDLDMFVDAYAAWQTSGAGTLATLTQHRLFSGQGATLRAENGFSLAFVGLDARYDDGHIGGVASLRFGEAVRIYHYKDDDSDATFGVDNIHEAYALWRPHASVELDVGLFLSPYGVESYESWRNPNYTRGAVSNYVQPTWHTGLRVQWQLNDEFSVLGFIANGSNNVSETQESSGLYPSPSVGAQLLYSPSELFTFALGGLAALDSENNDDGGYDGFADFVGTLQLGRLTASLNADLIVTRDGAPDGGDRYCWGAAVLGGYELTDSFGIGARGEYIRDDADYGGGDVWQLVTGTLTFDLKLTPLTLGATSPTVVLRWENRWEKSNQDVFGDDSRGTEDVADDTYTNAWFESVVGVVFTTAP